MSLSKKYNPFTKKLQFISDAASIVTQAILNKLYDNSLINAFRIAINGSLTKHNMIDGIMDEFEDESGVDTVNSIDEKYNTDSDFYYNYGVDANIKLLLPLDGINGQTSATDFSNLAHSISFYGDANLDTAQKKFGTTSLVLDGTDDYIRAADSSDFALGTGDFTIDMWIRPTQVVNQAVLINSLNAAPSNGFYFYIISGKLNYYDYTTNHASTTTLSVNVWQHVCIVRHSGTLKFYVDGVEAGGSFSLSRDLTADRCVVGYDIFHGSGFSGWIDEVRIVKGVAMWTANFTPPTSAYSTNTDVDNMTLISNLTEAEANPDSVRQVFMIEEVDSITINTDVKAYASRDDGANWVETTLSLEANIEDSKKVYAGTVDVSGQASDKTMKWKVQTFNEKALKIHGVGNLWD